MNKLQEKELELLIEFIGVCEKLNLQYYLVCGSALGAVKYKGFIPWDDDIDVAMPRKDYDIFIEKAPNILPEWGFVQTFKTDIFFPKPFCKLRNSNTTYIELPYKDLNINHGIFIDVFPLDGYPKGRLRQKLFKTKLMNYVRLSSCMLNIERSKKAEILNCIYRVLGYHKKNYKLLKNFESFLRKTTIKYSDYQCNYGNFRGDFFVNQANIYGGGIKAKFEGIDVIIPQKYDSYLRQLYGDYRKDPPIDEQKGHHHYLICDTEKPYREYI